MKSLKFRDILSLSNSIGSSYTNTLDKYQTYFRCMVDNSVGIREFSSWSKFTSIYDVPTIAFGIYNQTFPGTTNLDIKCAHCGKTMRNCKISNDQLISTRNEGVYEQLDRVINSINNLEKANKYSLVNKISRFQLPESKAVIDVHIPTIEDHLKLLESIPDGKMASVEAYLDVLLFIKDVYVVDLEATKTTGKPVFNPLKDRNEVLNFLKEIGLSDVNMINKEISDRDTKYKIEYQVKSFECTNQECKKQTGNIDIEIENLLFEQAVVAVMN